MNRVTIDVAPILSRVGEEIKEEGKAEFEPIATTFRELQFKDAIRFKLTLTNVGEGIFVTGEFAGRIQLPCSRCLDQFDYIVQVQVRELFHISGNEKFKVVADTIDVGPLAEQAIVMSMPVKTLCREDCRGLCPSCGVNRNRESCGCKQEHRDPRFAKLKDLLREK